MAKKTGLGKGIDAIFLDNALEDEKEQGQLSLRISQIDPTPGQPRKNFDKEAFDKAFDNNNLNEFCLFTLNEDGEPVILFEGIDTSEIDTAIENIVQSF